MAGPNHVFTFKKSEPAANGGPTMRHVVKVTVDGAGKVVKVVMGR